jgi:XRE family transcriptional regulator, regulator of sulfur utilization
VDKRAFGRRLKSLRSARGVSLAQVEAATAISSSFLSLVEQGRSDISIGRLMRLVAYYEVDLGELLADIPTDRHVEMQVVRHGERAVFRSPDEGIDMFVFGAGPSWGISPVLCVHEPGGAATVDGAPGIESFMYVIEGEFRFDLGAPEPVVLEAGDGAVFRSPGRYTVTNVASGPGQLIAVGVPVEAFAGASNGARAEPASKATQRAARRTAAGEASARRARTARRGS